MCSTNMRRIFLFCFVGRDAFDDAKNVIVEVYSHKIEVGSKTLVCVMCVAKHDLAPKQCLVGLSVPFGTI